MAAIIDLIALEDLLSAATKGVDLEKSQMDPSMRDGPLTIATSFCDAWSRLACLSMGFCSRNVVKIKRISSASWPRCGRSQQERLDKDDVLTGNMMADIPYL